MNYQIPLRKIPAQAVAFSIVNQTLNITLRQIHDKQFISLSCNNEIIAENVLVVCHTPLIEVNYKIFKGEFVVVDLYGKNDDPDYTEWGKRWVLVFKSVD